MITKWRINRLLKKNDGASKLKIIKLVYDKYIDIDIYRWWDLQSFKELLVDKVSIYTNNKLDKKFIKETLDEHLCN